MFNQHELEMKLIKMPFEAEAYITEVHVKEELDKYVLGLYEYLNTKNLDLKALSLHTYTQGSWSDLPRTTYYDVSFGQLLLNLNKKIRIFVEVKSGKYKGSIGHIARNTYDNKVVVQISQNNDTTRPLPVKALKFLPDHNGTYHMAVKQREIRDIFDQTIEAGDKVIFAERGKLKIGVLQEFDFHKNMAHIRTPAGKEIINPRKSDIVNCQKINETFISNSVLTAMLKS